MADFTFAYANVRSITASDDTGSRIDHISNLLILPHKCDLFACTETHLSDLIDDDRISISNFSLIRRDRNRRAGDTAIYIRADLKYRRRIDFENPNLELIWVEVILSDGSKLLFGVCYRPPGQSAKERTDFLYNFETTFDHISSSNENFYSIILTGDFNDSCSAWDGDHYNSELKK